MNRRVILFGSAAVLAGCASASVFTTKGIGTKGPSGAPVNTVQPTTTGSTPVGSVLTGTNGTWTGSPTFTYQWTSNGSNIGGATGASYTTVSGDIGNAIARKVIGTNGSGSATATSSNSITVTSGIATVTPGAGWNGFTNTGYAGNVPPVTPTDPSTWTTLHPMPNAHFFTVPAQAFSGDFIVDVIAKAPNGIASVEFYAESGSTTVVTSVNHGTIINGKTATAGSYDKFSIKLPASTWCVSTLGETTGATSGAAIYAKVTANAVGGVTMEPRIIGPLRIVPRLATLGQAHDKIVWISSNGKDNNGVTLVPPANCTVVNTIAQAELLISTGAYSTAYNPLVMFKKDGTYAPVSQRGWGSQAIFPNAYWTLTHDVGVSVTIGVASAPSYDHGANGATDYNHWYWLMMRGLVEFRDTSGNYTGLIFDHTNFAGFGTDTSPGYWDNHVRHTLLGVSPVSDPSGSGLSSPSYNLYWCNGPNPGFSTSPPNLYAYDPGFVGIGTAYEYVCANAGGGNNTNLNLENTYLFPRSGVGVNQQIVVGSYMKNSVTSMFDPGTAGLFTIQGPAGSTVDFTGSISLGQTATLTLHDGSGSLAIACGNGPSSSNFTVAQLCTTVQARTGWTCTAGSAATVSGWSARWGLPENGATGIPTTSSVIFDARQPVHTEWYHIVGYYQVGSIRRVDNFISMNNVTNRPSRWGSALYQAENTGTANVDRFDNAYIVNNIGVTTTPAADAVALILGSCNQYANNYANDQQDWPTGLGGENATQVTGSILVTLQGSTGSTTTVLKNNLTNLTGVHALDPSNVDMTGGQITALFVSESTLDLRSGGLSIIPSHQVISPEPYDIFGVLRDPTGDYPGPLSKNSQGSAHVWPSQGASGGATAWVSSSPGITGTGAGAYAFTSASAATNDLVIVQVLDSGGGPPTLTLTGSSTVLTQIGPHTETSGQNWNYYLYWGVLASSDISSKQITWASVHTNTEYVVTVYHGGSTVTSKQWVTESSSTLTFAGFAPSGSSKGVIVFSQDGGGSNDTVAGVTNGVNWTQRYHGIIYGGFWAGQVIDLTTGYTNNSSVLTYTTTANNVSGYIVEIT